MTGALAFHGGTPYTVTSSSNPSGNGDSADRAVQVAIRPNAVSHGIGAVSPGAVQWFSPTAFVDAPPEYILLPAVARTITPATTPLT